MSVLLSKLHEVKMQMPGFSLFHLLMTLGIKEFLKYLDLQKTVLTRSTCK